MCRLKGLKIGPKVVLGGKELSYGQGQEPGKLINCRVLEGELRFKYVALQGFFFSLGCWGFFLTCHNPLQTQVLCEQKGQ